MQLVEIRDLDGPNLFMLEPAIKVELILENNESSLTVADRLVPGSSEIQSAAEHHIAGLHLEHGLAVPRVVVRPMDDPTHISIAFGWGKRHFGLTVGHAIADAARSVVVNDNLDVKLHASLTERADDAPGLVLERDRTCLAVGVTGTNGKTTTTRLISHLLRTAGYRTGWTSSSGIYIDGIVIEEGDYSGPSGAGRILRDSSVQAAVLETARGGILLRGLGYQHNDVSVFTNVSADHLGLQGVTTLETLAETKAVVCRVTKSEGTVVVNADDPRVLRATDGVLAPRTFFSQQANNPDVELHRSAGGTTVVASDGMVRVHTDNTLIMTIPLSQITLTHNGRATHMVENALGAIGAAVGLRLPWDRVMDGLKTFANDAEHNPGRLNIYRCGSFKVVLDFAHNEAGLANLLTFGEGELGDSGRLISIIGTAGDRTDESLIEIGRIATLQSDIVIAKGTTHYLRGRTLDALMGLYRAGAEAGRPVEYIESTNEVTALEEALGMARAGDVIVMMVHEHVPELVAILNKLST